MKTAALVAIVALAVGAMIAADVFGGISCAMPFGTCYRPNGAVRFATSVVAVAAIALPAWLALKPPQPALSLGASIAFVLWLGFAAIVFSFTDATREDYVPVYGFAGPEQMTPFHVQLARLFFPAAAASAAILSFAPNVPRLVKMAAGAAAGIGIASAFG